MDFGTFFPIAVILVTLILVSRGIRVVQQAQTIVIERLGRYHRTLHSGINLILPILDKPRAIDWRFTQVTPAGEMFVRRYKTDKIDLREAVYDFPRQSVITKDNVQTEINALIYYQVTDPVRAVYEIANLPDAIEKLTQTTLRNVIGEMDLDQTLGSRDVINSKLRAILDEATNKWGVKVNRVELQDISPPRDIKDAMEKQMRAERDRRATILTAEADKQSKILGAEAEASARLTVAEAEAEAITRISKAIGSDGDPAKYLIAVRYIEALKGMVTGENNKVVYLPYEATGVLSSLGGIKELLTGTAAQDKGK